jgi:putative SOS response-associated peptidase YedK
LGLLRLIRSALPFADGDDPFWLSSVLRSVGNLPQYRSIFPDKFAPVVRNAPDGKREPVNLRWGMPSPPAFLKPGQIDPGVTNIRNASSPHWRRWLEPGNRCVVPATSFCEPSTLPDPATGRKIWTWFALGEARGYGVTVMGWTAPRRHQACQDECCHQPV